MAASDYNPRKAAQVIAYFVKQSPGERLNVVKAVKLVYLADRESIKRHGFPILDEDRYSMPLGPVNSTTYNYVNGEIESPQWSAILQDRENHEISVEPDAPLNDWDELSDADIECLDAVWEKFGKMSQWDLVTWTHDRKNIPEWEDPMGSSTPIPLERIMTMLRIDNADDHASLINEQRNLTRTIASLRKH